MNTLQNLQYFGTVIQYELPHKYTERCFRGALNVQTWNSIAKNGLWNFEIFAHQCHHIYGFVMLSDMDRKVNLYRLTSTA